MTEITDKIPTSKQTIEIKDAAIKFGLIGGLAGILISLILFFSNLQYETWAKWLQSLIMLITIFLGVKSIADAHKNRIIPFGILFKSGMFITVSITLISVVYFFVYANFIETDFVNNLLDLSRKQMAERGLSEEQIEQGIELSKKFMSPGIMAVISTFSSLIIGAIVSLISAAVLKKDSN